MKPSRTAGLLVLFMLMTVPPLISAAAPRSHALLIGIGNYQNPDSSKNFLSLRGPAHDVAMVKNMLMRQFRFKEGDIRVLTDAQASRRGILDALNRLQKTTAPGDWVFIYYSGHGTRIKDTDGDESDGYDEALVAYDFKYGSRDGLVTDDELAAVFQRLRSRRIMVVMDSCHSGTATRSIYKTPFIPRYVPPSNVSGFAPSYKGSGRGLEDRPLPGGHIHLAAAQDEQVAVEAFFPDKQEYHGLFTLHLVNGLQGEADSNRDGAVTLRELYAHCKTRVTLVKGDQTPAISFGSESLLRQPVLAGKPLAPTAPVNTAHSGNIRIKIEGAGIIGAADLQFPGSGFRVEIVGGAGDWDYMIDKRGQYRLYSNSGYLLLRSPRLSDLERRLEAAVLKSFFKRLANPRRDFNIEADAGRTGQYYFHEKDSITYAIEAEADCYLLWLAVDSGGTVTVLVPNSGKGGGDNFLKKGKRYVIPGAGKGINFDFEVGPPFGRDLLKFIGFRGSVDLREIFPGCRDEFSYVFDLDSKACNSWTFYRKLKTLLDQRRDWSETAVEIETLPLSSN